MGGLPRQLFPSFNATALNEFTRGHGRVGPKYKVVGVPAGRSIAPARQQEYISMITWNPAYLDGATAFLLRKRGNDFRAMLNFLRPLVSPIRHLANEFARFCKQRWTYKTMLQGIE